MRSFVRKSLVFPVIDKGRPSQEVIILLHGFPATAESWLPVAMKLTTSGYRVLIPEQRGYASGARPKHRRDYRINELVDDVKALIKQAGVTQAHIVGHDWGGIVAWAFASTYPEQVSSLTVVSTPHPRAFTASLWKSRQLLLSWYIVFFQLPYLPEWSLARKHGAVLARSLAHSGLKRDSALQYIQRIQGDRNLLKPAINWYRALPFSAGHLRKIGFITPPTLFVYGGKDHFLSIKAATLTKGWIIGRFAEQYVPSGSHWIPEESPEMLASSILSFIRQNNS